jgi:hypothetical protein
MTKYGKMFANRWIDDRVVVMGGKPIRSSLRKKVISQSAGDSIAHSTATAPHPD